MIFFITGTDTDIGKTITVGLLAKTAKELGKQVITQKLVQTGAKEPIDLLVHRQMMGLPLDPPNLLRYTCPYLFSYPAAPKTAAGLEDKRIDLLVLKRALEELALRYEIVFIEGVGGLWVPLTQKETLLDFLSLILCPVVVVCAARLGTINHTLLTIEALRQRSLFVAGLVYNLYFMNDEFLAEESLLEIKRLSGIENVLKLPRISERPPLQILEKTANFLKLLRVI